MITINDNDLPVTVAEKLINGTKEIEDERIKKLNSAFGGDGKQDMFKINELREIAEYLLVYYNSNNY